MKDFLRIGIIISLGIAVVLCSAFLRGGVKSLLVSDAEERCTEEEKRLEKEEISQRESLTLFSPTPLSLIATYCYILMSFKAEALPYRLAFLTKHILNHSPPFSI